MKQYTAVGVDMKFLANKSAFYSHVSERIRHWGLNKDYYCHSTSPIRRFADIVNQMALVGDEIPELTVENLNMLSIRAKKYERDIFFLNKVLVNKTRTVHGTTLNDHRVWVPAWNRIVTCKNDSNIGTNGVLSYSLDMSKPNWKKRMVFRFEDIDCPE
jgi:hypothetical protein